MNEYADRLYHITKKTTALGFLDVVTTEYTYLDSKTKTVFSFNYCGVLEISDEEFYDKQYKEIQDYFDGAVAATLNLSGDIWTSFTMWSYQEAKVEEILTHRREDIRKWAKKKLSE